MNTDITFETRDEFDRKLIAENINKLICSNIDLSPLMIDGDWGTGKTEFSYKLANFLKKTDNRNVIYIDAFREDHSDEPLLSITAAIAKNLPEKGKSTFIKKSLPALRSGLKITGKAVVSWALKQEADKIADEFNNALKEVSDKAIDSTVDNILADHIAAEENIRTLQITLEMMSEERNIIIIVDELDRCRPSFAVEFLEKIKHIFNVKNVLFVLIANGSQLKASINHIYGYSIDAQKYLDKFLKYSISLPKMTRISDLQDRMVAVTQWYSLIENNDLLRSVHKALSNIAGDLPDQIITSSNLSLRETETFARHLSIYQTLSSNQIGLGTNPLINIAKVMGILFHSQCSREILEDFPSKNSIETMAKKLNITSLPFESDYDLYDVPILEMVFFMIIKDDLPLDSFLSAKAPATPSNLEGRIYKNFGTSLVKQLSLRKTMLNTIAIMSTAK